MNAPDREDAVFLESGDVKVAYKLDPKIENAAHFVLIKEDHTVGNIMRMKLLEDENVLFAGYRHPHPLERLIEMKIRTTGEKNAPLVAKEALSGLIEEMYTIENRFKEAIEKIAPEHHDMVA